MNNTNSRIFDDMNSPVASELTGKINDHFKELIPSYAHHSPPIMKRKPIEEQKVFEIEKTPMQKKPQFQPKALHRRIRSQNSSEKLRHQQGEPTL